MLLLRHARPNAITQRLTCDRCRGRTLSNSSRAASEGRPFRILFCGSDEFSVASLKAVHQARDLWSSIDVVVPAEREVGRGGKQHSRQDKYVPALREYGERHQLPISVIPSTGIKTWTPPYPFADTDPAPGPAPLHLLLTASFGHIIPLRLLRLFPEDNRLNVHPSLLPRWRGAAPVQWTIANGDESTGVSVQRLVRYGKGIDSGDIVGSTGNISVPNDATYSSLLPHLAEVGGELLVDVLRKIKAGKASFVPQDENNITLAPKITHETAHIRWVEQDAATIDRLYRGIHHQIPLWTTVLGVSAQLHQLKVAPTPPEQGEGEAAQPGDAILQKQGKERRLLISCAGGSWLQVGQIQMAGKKALPVKAWWNGLRKDIRDSGRVQFG